MINALTLLLGIYIVYASVDRIINPEMPDAYWMFGISILGISLNGIGVWKLLCLDKIEEVSHLYIWSLTEEKAVVTIHVTVSGVSVLTIQGQQKSQIQNIFSDMDTEHISIDL